MTEVSPENIQANGLWNAFSGMKRWTVTCGHCKYTWAEKLPIVERITTICPHCDVVNVWSASAFNRVYEKQIKS